ncbi:salicylate 1-monooxygenase [Jejubacter calystegiae]|nr:salicylate 1-monooxygenase [Jejubacter calystegiae]
MNQTMPRRTHLQVAIAGGGIAGVTLALALSRLPHISLSLYESAHGFSEVGAGISIGPNAVRILDWLGVGDAYREAADSLAPPWRDIWFEWRTAASADLIGTTLAPPVGQSSIHRADLLDLLTEKLPSASLHFNKRIIDARTGADGRVSLEFSDGSRACCDLLIGADGIHSALRNIVLTERGLARVDPLFTGTLAWRGLIETETLNRRFDWSGFDRRLIDIPQMHLGDNAHILTFPVKKGALINVVAFRTDPARRHVALAPDEPWVTGVSRPQLMAEFEGWSAPVRTILSAIKRPSRWALHELPPLETWHTGHIALIGDAAHAMLPHQGAGAGQGIEDAWFLSRLLSAPTLTRRDIPVVLRQYDALRRPRATAVQRTSSEAGDLYEMRSLAARQRPQLEHQLATRFDWLWQHDLRRDLERARSALGA